MDQSIRLLYTSIAGIIAGFLGGLLGMSGTVIMLPLLVLFNIFNNYKIAIGTVLFSFDPFGSIFALVKNVMENKIDYYVALTLFFTYIFGSYIGTLYNAKLSEKTIKYLTATILLFLSIYMFYNGYNIKP
jgi:uncharacterized membrane protein YfcA